MDKDQILKILEAYEQGTLSADELLALKKALLNLEIMDEQTLQNINFQESQERVKKKLMAKIESEEQQYSSETRRLSRNRGIRILSGIAIGTAASVIVAIGIISKFESRKAIPESHLNEIADIEPATFKAKLSINSSPSSYKLTGNIEDSIVLINGALVKAPSPNTIVYQSYENLVGDQIPSINTVSTPRGGTYNVILSDGTEVMLNAASSISFPVPFAKDKREVTIKGEAFFKVKPQLLSNNSLAKPFIVKAQVAPNQIQIIKVLGTHFNVHAQPNSPIITSLVEGKVQVTTQKDTKTILPGEKTILVNGLLSTGQMDSQEIAWTKNLFEFQDQTLETIMAEASRWYNVDIEFGNDVDLSQKYTITLERNKGLKTFTSIIESLGFECSLEKDQDANRLFVKSK
ncbi:hypothetical protein COR50_18375 [Chitinophaga caeni]|uniref:FecR family protein n=1 Tax=Chitinophaga caeni TaxID=2029983 RepID=A0A291QYH5_9BACT|nr:FecR family protein [Chitinophaga caeni]ATL48977.1 hypothetical protein COR50_18375 [Chitinophaga caeni]